MGRRAANRVAGKNRGRQGAAVYSRSLRRHGNGYGGAASAGQVIATGCDAALRRRDEPIPGGANERRHRTFTGSLSPLSALPGGIRRIGADPQNRDCFLSTTDAAANGVLKL